MFILAQISSLISMIVNIVAVQLKTKRQMLLTIIVANLFFVISYVLLKAYVGALIYGIINIEIIINMFFENRGKLTPKWLISIYFFISIIVGFFTFNNIIDTLPIIAAIFFIITFRQTKEKYVRFLILENLISWIVYDFFVSAYLAVVSDLFIAFSTIVAIIRYDIRKGEKGKNGCNKYTC